MVGSLKFEGFFPGNVDTELSKPFFLQPYRGLKTTVPPFLTEEKKYETNMRRLFFFLCTAKVLEKILPNTVSPPFQVTSLTFFSFIISELKS